MFKVEWKYKGNDSWHNEEFTSYDGAFELFASLRNQYGVVSAVCLIDKDGETYWG